MTETSEYREYTVNRVEFAPFNDAYVLISPGNECPLFAQTPEKLGEWLAMHERPFLRLIYLPDYQIEWFPVPCKCYRLSQNEQIALVNAYHKALSLKHRIL